ncbi:MAG: DUF5320 domain-containing protein [Deltaproteobacteria bacterium]|nr:DUF5320 domain-containing protein [Deltaproteobacteria bacterium]
MPGGDRMGPQGMGPMTGRGAGLCAGYPAPGYMNAGFGRGFGRGRGGGRGRRNWFYATGLTGWQRTAYGYPAYGAGMPYNMPYSPEPSAPYTAGFSKEDELNALKSQAEYLGDSLEAIKRRMSELSGEAAQE